MLTHRPGAQLGEMARLLGLGPGRPGVCWLPRVPRHGADRRDAPAIYAGTDLVMFSPVAFSSGRSAGSGRSAATAATSAAGPTSPSTSASRTITPEERAGLDLSSLELAFIGAEPVHAETLDAFAEAFAPYGFRREAFYPCYGLAESTLIVSGAASGAPPRRSGASTRGARAERGSCRASADEGAQVLVGCGTAVDGLDVRHRRPRDARPVPGRSSARSGSRGRASRRATGTGPRRPRRTFGAPAGRTSTTDLPADRRPRLPRRGRAVRHRPLKDLIIIRGRNYYPQDIEDAVEGCAPASATAPRWPSRSRRPPRPARRPPRVNRHHRDAGHDEAVRAIRAADRRAVRDRGPRRRARQARDSRRPRAGRSGGTNACGCTGRANSSRRPRSILRSARSRSAIRGAGLGAGADRRPRHAGWPPRRTRREIRGLAVVEDRPAPGPAGEAIDPSQPFATFGLDSVTMVGISGELEAWLSSRCRRPCSTSSHHRGACAPPVGRARGAPRSESASTAGEDPLGGDRDRRHGLPVPGGRHGRGVLGDCSARGATAWGRCPHGRDGLRSRRGSRRDAAGSSASVDGFDPQFFGICPGEAVYGPAAAAAAGGGLGGARGRGHAADRLAGRRRRGLRRHLAATTRRCWSRRDRRRSTPTRPPATRSASRPNRLSYSLDLHGPSLAVDTACSSSLVACTSPARACGAASATLALAGGVNLMLSPGADDRALDGADALARRPVQDVRRVGRRLRPRRGLRRGRAQAAGRRAARRRPRSSR